MIKGKNLIKIILWESVSLYTTLTKFPVKQRKELSNILAHVDCEQSSRKPSLQSLMTEANDVKHS